jgi:two-component system sensor histidine kinase QseC
VTLRSIRGRLVAALLLGLGVLFVAAASLVYTQTRAILVEDFRASLRGELRAMGAHLWVDPTGAVYVDWTEELLPEFGAQGDMAFQLWLEEGTRVQRSPLLEQGHGDLPRLGGTVKQPAYGEARLPDGRPALTASTRVVPRPTFDPSTTEHDPAVLTRQVELAVARDATPLEARLARLRWLMVTTGVGLPLATALLVALVVRRGLRPLDRVAARAAAIDRLGAGARFPLDGLPAELEPICERLNGLLERLEQLLEREKRFTSDAAHELRTPIAELRILTEVALRFADDGEHARRALTQAHDIARQMGAMVASLLALARKDAMSADVVREPVDVAALFDAAFDPVAGRAAARGLSLRVNAPESLVVDSDPSLLKGIFGNLLANACEYSPTGTRIQATLRARNGGFQLELGNLTQDLDAADLEHLFEPFWRKEGSRGDKGHFGLGLALARNLAELVGMTLEARMPRPGEIVFVLAPNAGAAPA